ncbi:MAG: hypothetical protein KDD58_11035 [Bdellovibrionales bacterium]|nr:hypothetical protein [Bdellovibrionales bacterium]
MIRVSIFVLFYSLVSFGSEVEMLNAYEKNQYPKAFELLAKEINNNFSIDKYKAWQRLAEDMTVNQFVSLEDLSQFYLSLSKKLSFEKSEALKELSLNALNISQQTKGLSSTALANFTEFNCSNDKIASVFCVILTTKALKSDLRSKRQYQLNIIARKTWNPGSERRLLEDYITLFPKDKWSEQAYSLLMELYELESQTSSGPLGLSKEQKLTLLRLKKKMSAKGQ